jgi:hypothetical protein
VATASDRYPSHCLCCAILTNLAIECENLAHIGFITSGIGLYILCRSRIRCFLAAKRAEIGFDSRRPPCSHARLSSQSAEMPTLTKVLAQG